VATVEGVPRREPIVAVLVGWTLFVWATRIGNTWSDHSTSTGEKLGSTALALSFTALAAVVLVAWLQRRPWLTRAVLVLGAWTAGVWASRLVAIATDHRGAGFVAVHGVLAVVSVVLAWLALERLERPARDLSSATANE
jgi:hypothetical protein